MSQQDIKPLYQDLFKSNFISTYGATNPWDDFAETIAYYVMDRYLYTKYQLDTSQDKAYNVIDHLNSSVMQAKFRYVEEFLKRKDLHYPGAPQNLQ